MNSLDSEFWNPEHFALNDETNQRIWSESPKLQREIELPEKLLTTGAIGAQQAMLVEGFHPSVNSMSVLPWVPDIVGKRTRLLIVGSAYAGFISEFSSRQNTLPLSEYVTAVSAAEFQARFLGQVVSEDSAYYGKIRQLFDPECRGSDITLIDLCRASFVRRGVGNPYRRVDKSGDSVVRLKPEVFEKYAENPEAQNWTWRRIIQDDCSVIVTLGSIAEHGLLRLLAKKGMIIREAQTNDSLTLGSFKCGRWVLDCAKYKLYHWLNHNTWWSITGSAGGRSRNWRLLPIYHPASEEFDFRLREIHELLESICYPN